VEIAEFHIAAALLEQTRVAEVARERESRRQEAERAAAAARERDRLEAETAGLIDALRPSCEELRRSRTDLKNQQAGFLRLKESMQSRFEPLSPRSRAHVEEVLGWDELAELPPLPTGPISESASASASASAPCVICTDSPAIRALVPCGHLCLCNECAVQFLHSASQRACPLCRVHATSTLRIYRQD
jgi:Zinc finger, C3HC4 type (RING finger)